MKRKTQNFSKAINIVDEDDLQTSEDENLIKYDWKNYFTQVEINEAIQIIAKGEDPPSER